MEIIYLGHSCFKLVSSGKQKKLTIVTDPFDSTQVGLKLSKTEADIVTVSHQHPDHNSVSSISGVKRVIEGPGEYEVEGISIIGIPSFHDNEKGVKRGKNTIFIIEMDGVRVAHLGDLGHELSTEVLEEMGDINVLLIPVGGEYTIDADQAAAIVKKLEPNITIPMHFQSPGLNTEFAGLTTVEGFLNKLGISHLTQPKLVVKDGASLEEEQKVVVLEKK